MAGKKRLAGSSSLAGVVVVVASFVAAITLSPSGNFKGCSGLQPPSQSAASSPSKSHPFHVHASVRVRSLRRQIAEGYGRRVAADPRFVSKSLIEVMLAAATQLLAEYQKRGGTVRGLIRESDFVVAGVLTAVVGKYYSMWKVAKTSAPSSRASYTDADTATIIDNEPAISTTVAADDVSATIITDDNNSHLSTSGNTTAASGIYDNIRNKNQDPILLWTGLSVPTNAFQSTMGDGHTVPTFKQRLGSFVQPVPSLFRAGVLAGAVGYGCTYVGILLRSYLVPGYQTATQNMNVVAACLYTGAFMAVFSNIRYHILQGVVEPAVERSFDRFINVAQQHRSGSEDNDGAKSKDDENLVRRLAIVSRDAAIFALRFLNGVLGSWLAISGMRLLGLQRLKPQL